MSPHIRAPALSSPISQLNSVIAAGVGASGGLLVRAESLAPFLWWHEADFLGGGADLLPEHGTSMLHLDLWVDAFDMSLVLGLCDNDMVVG